MKKKIVSAIVCIAAVGTGLVSYMLMPENSANKYAGNEIRKNYEPLEEKKEYTVLVYMNGSDLESGNQAATKDIGEMREAIRQLGGKEETNFHLAVEAGGSRKWNRQARFSLSASGAEHMETMKPRNMGEADTLADFLNYGMTSFPAEKYILVFWNHGNGSVEGFGNDEIFDGDSLKLAEIKEAFGQSEMERYNFELVGFDACLMGTAETAYMMPDNVNYMIASPELEPEEGWDYEWLKVLQKPQKRGDEIGEKIAETYVKSQQEQKLPISLTVTDVAKLKCRCDEWNYQFNQIRWEKGAIQLALQKRNTMYEYLTGTGDIGTSSQVGFEDVVSAVVYETELTQPGLLEGITKKWGNEAANRNPNTLSVYFPKEVWNYPELRDYEETGFMGGYFKMLECIYNSMEEAPVTYKEIKAYEEEKLIEAAVLPERLRDTQGVVLLTYLNGQSGERYVINSDTDVEIHRQRNTVTGHSPEYLMSYEGELFTALEESTVNDGENDYVTVLSPVLHNGEFSCLQVEFSEEYPDGLVLGIFPMSDDGKSEKRLGKIKPGDKLTPLYPKKYMSMNEMEDFYKGKRITIHWKEGEEMCMESVPINSVGIEVEFEFLLLTKEERNRRKK